MKTEINGDVYVDGSNIGCPAACSHTQMAWQARAVGRDFGVTCYLEQTSPTDYIAAAAGLSYRHT